MSTEALETFRFNKVLLIDDTDVDNLISTRVIRKTNFAADIIIKTTAEDALSYLENSNGEYPQLIFLDLRLPLMDGFEFLKEYELLHSDEKNHCKIVVLSSSINPDDVNRATSSRFVIQFISKPLMREHIQELYRIL